MLRCYRKPSLGNLLNSWLTPLYSLMSPGRYFGMLTLMMAMVTLAFAFVAAWINRADAVPTRDDGKTEAVGGLPCPGANVAISDPL